MYPNFQNKVYNVEHLDGFSIFSSYKKRTRVNIFKNADLWVCWVTFLWNLLECIDWNKGYGHHYGSCCRLLNFLSNSKILGFLENLIFSSGCSKAWKPAASYWCHHNPWKWQNRHSHILSFHGWLKQNGNLVLEIDLQHPMDEISCYTDDQGPVG